ELAALRQAQAEGQLELAGVGEARVRVVLPGGVEHPHEGTVDFSDVTVDPATGAVSLRARVPNPDLTLLPGAFVTLKVRLGERHGVFVLPQSALLRDPSGAYVWLLLPDGTVTRRDVTVDSSRDGNVLITAGLEAGDRVITSGLQKVREGAMAVPSVPAGTTAQAGGSGDAGAGPDD